MKRQRRALPEASISFLDVISCGFGAIVLLLVIARVGDPAALEEAENKLRSTVKDYQELLFDVRGESVVLNEQLKSRKQQLSELTERVARLKAKLASVEKQSAQISQSEAREKEQLQLVLQVLSEEMERLLGPEFKQQNQLIGGIPVDSDYIIFVIDTSGSMQVAAWEKVKKEMINILDIYPDVKGLQVLNDMGQYMFSAYRGRWIPDSPQMRETIVSTLTTGRRLVTPARWRELMQRSRPSTKKIAKSASTHWEMISRAARSAGSSRPSTISTRPTAVLIAWCAFTLSVSGSLSPGWNTQRLGDSIRRPDA